MSKPTKTINDKMKQLDQELAWFYGEDFRLSEAVEKYRAANKLAGEIDHELAELQNQVEVIEDFTKS